MSKNLFKWSLLACVLGLTATAAYAEETDLDRRVEKAQVDF